GSCGVNLAAYLTDRKETIGVIAKGCDSRNIVTHIIENKIKRDQVYIIGVPCKGMIDKRKISALSDDEITAVTETATEIQVTRAGGEETLERVKFLQQNCAECLHRNPVLHDELVAEPVEEQTDVERFADVREIEAMTADEKWSHFDKMLETCIRCYACRNACPLCYCPTCFVDESRPQWVGKSQNSMDVRTFHFLRAYHCAGRCTECGACERACPMGINVRAFTRKLVKDGAELFGWEAGMSLDQRPLLDCFNPKDPDDFIK
ncbi:MAG: 4Fe-4S ferredoxin, partial [Desulfobacterales bacterium]|nr:4Fe-4S ferredoxin [Desulfobacterales bacterium]